MKRWGLPEYLGIAVSLVCLTWWSPVNDYLAGPKLLVLVAAGLGALPAIIYRWRKGLHPRGVVLLPALAALGVVAWSALSLLLSGAPLPASLLGWWGRSNGFLSLLGAGLIMLAATTLRREEVPRVVTWLLAGATVTSLIGLAQLSGNQVVGGLPDPSLIATMGNINFSAAYFAMMSLLAAGRALSTDAPAWQRVWAGGLTALLIGLAVLTTAAQGPAAVGAGAIAMLVLWALAYHGERRTAALAAAGAVVVVSASVLLVSFIGVGPLAGLWQDINFRVRQGTWLIAWEIAQAMPIFGTGPDGLQRYSAEYAPDFYVEIIGTRVTLSAAHNVPLQYAATLGITAAVLWLIAMVGAGLLLLLTMARERVTQAIVAASVGGAFVGYLAQAMVSIDMGGLLATGWLLLGMVIALSRAPARRRDAPAPPDADEEPASATPESPEDGETPTDLEVAAEPEPALVSAAATAPSTPSVPPRGKSAGKAPTKGGPKGKRRTLASGPARPRPSGSKRPAPSRSPKVPLREKWRIETPVWVPLTGLVLASLGAVGVAQAIRHDARSAGEMTAEQLISTLQSPWTPCASRIPLVQLAVRDLPPEQSVPTTYDAVELDPRCDTISHFQAELSIQNQQIDIAERSTLASITYNPDNNISWILRARYHLLVGDLQAAEEDYAIAAELTGKFPGNEQGTESLQRLRADLDAAAAG